jgi:hypothetical protein
MSLHRAVSLPAVLLLTSAALAGCADSSGSADGAKKIAITATDTACEVASTEFSSGPVTFSVTNKGDRSTEVYVYGEDDHKYTKVVSEVENIGPGTSREMTATLGAGDYEIACKPGQKGDGIRAKITVTGEKAAAGEEKYDREIEVELKGGKLEGTEGLTAKVGEKIEFKFENTAADERELQILDPAGKVAGEIPATGGKTGETIVELATAGDWTLKVEDTELTATLTVS